MKRQCIILVPAGTLRIEIQVRQEMVQVSKASGNERQLAIFKTCQRYTASKMVTHVEVEETTERWNYRLLGELRA